MKKRFFPIVTLVLAIAFAVVAYDDYSVRQKLEMSNTIIKDLSLQVSDFQKNLALMQEEADELQEALANKTLEVENHQLINSFPLYEENSALHYQCFLEMSWQIWGVNLLYCEELERPVICAVSEKNWNLINGVGFVNFSKQEVDKITLSLCSLDVEIEKLYYLPTNDKLSLAENPPESGWIEVSSEAGKYTIPLTETEKNGNAQYTAIKYNIGNDTYYSIIATGLKSQ